MTIAELLEGAQRLIEINKRAFVDPESLRIALAIVDLLGEVEPCGWGKPYIRPDNQVELAEWFGRPTPVPRSEARALAVMLLRVAEEPEVSS